MTLSSNRPLEAHLWRLVVQSDAKVQPVFRLYWNYDTRSSPDYAYRCGASVPGWPGYGALALSLLQ
jgi:hypothetical protein